MSEVVSRGGCRCRARDGGFTLIESIVASVILLVISIGVITALIATGGWYSKTIIRTQASSLAAEVMAEIRSRNFDALQVVAGADESLWPASIPATMTMSTINGEFSVETSVASVVDTLATAPMKRIVVTVDSVRQPMAKPVTAIAYASGWSGLSAEAAQYTVPVVVQCVDDTVNKNVSDDHALRLDGVRVELRDVNDLDVVRYVGVTNADGIAYLPAVAEDEYWLTSDPTNPVAHAKYFPRRIYPSHGQSGRATILPQNRYNLAIVRRTGNANAKATLCVGAFRDAGWPSASPKPIVGLKVYAQAQLNPDSESAGYFGTGANADGTRKTRYPQPADDPRRSLTYSAFTNAYGIAVIEVPWTLETGQTWHVWYNTTLEYRDKITTYPGTWVKLNGDKKSISEPEMPPPAGGILQFQYVIGEPTEVR